MELDTLYYGDCLDWMARWPGDSVDLVYLDPPFNSNANYNVLFASDDPGGRAQIRAFDDTWRWDADAVARCRRIADGAARPSQRAIAALHGALGDSGTMAYLAYMAERLEQLRRLLKPGGSIYLHCDPTASHYLKTLMDGIFGHANFRREIIWNLQTASGYKSRVKGYIRGHDTILYYTAGPAFRFNAQHAPHKEEYVQRFRKIDSEGRRYRDDRSGKRRQYLDDTPGVALTDVWSDIMSFQQHSSAPERLGYPTQKPLALLDRIVRVSSDPGNVVLDPFCGCGTTVEAARRLDRRWIGIDISAFAIDLIRKRRLKDENIATQGLPQDMVSARKLARERPFDFESWAVMRLPGFAPNTRQRGDGGIDGRGIMAVQPGDRGSKIAVAQVKGGKFALNQFQAFANAVEQVHRAALGIFVTLDPVASPTARREARALGEIAVHATRYPRMQLWSIADYFDGRMPQLPPMTDPHTGNPLRQLDLFQPPARNRTDSEPER